MDDKSVQINNATNNPLDNIDSQTPKPSTDMHAEVHETPVPSPTEGQRNFSTIHQGQNIQDTATVNEATVHVQAEEHTEKLNTQENEFIKVEITTNPIEGPNLNLQEININKPVGGATSINNDTNSIQNNFHENVDVSYDKFQNDAAQDNSQSISEINLPKNITVAINETNNAQASNVHTNNPTDDQLAFNTVNIDNIVIIDSISAGNAGSFDNPPTATPSPDVVVAPPDVAQTPLLTVSNANGDENSAISLEILVTSEDLDGSELVSVIISGLPNGAILSAGIENADGSWTLTPDDLNGLSLLPPDNFGGVFSLTVTATSTEIDGSTASISKIIDVDVKGVADTPTLTTKAANGSEEQAIALDIQSALTDTDGSESLSITIFGVPTGAVLSAGINNNDGTWTLTPAQLTNLTITPPANSNADFNLTVTATSTENDGSTSSTSKTIAVDVKGVADTPTLTTSAATGFEDQSIALNIQSALTDTDGSENLSIIISGVPAGAVLSAGINNNNGSWTLTPAQLTNLKITPPANSNTDFNLTVTATSTENDGSTSSTSQIIAVDVKGVADTPTLTTSAATGFEDQSIALNIQSALTDVDGSESLSITISGVPNGAILSAGTNNHDGSWTLTPGQLTNLKITPPANSNQDFNLTVKTTSTENDGSTSSITNTINVDVKGVADTPTLHTSSVTGSEAHPIALNIQSALIDTDGSENLSFIIAGVPDGGFLSAGVNNGDSTWTLSANDLNNLSFTSPYGANNYNFTVTAIATENDGSKAPTSSSFTVQVNLAGLTINGTNSNETLTGGNYSDTISGKGGKDIIYGGSGNDTISGDGGDDTLYGEANNDFITGGTGNDTIYGGSGNDTLYGDAGQDLIDGGDGNDTIFGGNAVDTITGGQGNDIINGDAGNDILKGNEGNDTIYGGDGNDTLQGDAGNDTLYGEKGNDLFIFGSGSGTDVIDGDTGNWTDNIQLSNVTQGPTGSALTAGSWVLSTQNSYTINTQNHSITFNSKEASGTITLWDGSQMQFSNIEQIHW